MREKVLAFLSTPAAEGLFSDPLREVLRALLGAPTCGQSVEYTCLPPAGTLILRIDGSEYVWAQCTLGDVRAAIQEVAEEIGEDGGALDDLFADAAAQMYEPMPELEDYL